MLSLLLAASILGGVPIVEAQERSALSVPASSKWYGPDGNWSAFEFTIGVRTDTAQQRVDLQISTALSEVWIIDDGGCLPTDNLCKSLRGGVVKAEDSIEWKPIGLFQLALEYLGLGGNGDYGLDHVAVENQVTDRRYLSMKDTVIAAINDTDYFTGFFGLGLTAGKFGQTVVTAPFERLIMQPDNAKGGIPSRSYGYTAGAWYANKGQGVPASLTLGGYDQKRFVPHSTQFVFNSTLRLPEALVRGITAKAPSMDKAPKHWKSTEELLLGFNNSINALIDTSTPFLWMPNDACDRFAAAFNLTYNETLELYTFQSGQQYEDFLHNSPLSLTFSLSSFDNYDNFAHPLSVNGVVNITVSIAAFAQLVKYPYMNKIGPYESAIPYFPLKRTTHKNRYILGRAFMQEAYMIMRYEEGTFSVHQALMPDNAIYNTDIKSIARPDRSLYDKPPSAPRGRSSLSTAQMAGIASGVCALITAGIATYCCVRRRRRAKNAPPLPEFTLKDAVSSIETVASPLKKPAGRILSIIKWKKSPRENANAAAGTAEHPAEVCGRDNAVYELPVPLEPVELDTHDSSSVNGSTELGSESAQGLSEYEIARRKLERQLQGPVPAYSPPSISQSSSSASKSEQDVSPVAHYRPSDHHPSPPSPLSSPIHGTFANAIPSPITPQVPHSDWGHFPSLMTVAAPATTMPPPPSPEINQGSSIHSSGSAGVCSQTYNPSSVSPSSLTHASATSPVASLAGSVVLPPSPTYQRTPIDPSRVICLGPLPDNIQLPRQPSLPQVAGSSAAASFPRSPVTTRSPHTNILQVQSPPPAQTTTPLGTLNQAARVSVETLGSNFTEEEEERIAEEARQQQSLRLDTTLLQRADYGRSPLTATAGSSAGPLSAVVATPRSAERIEAGVELVHVPQVPEKRYSWEENGTMDDDGPQ